MIYYRAPLCRHHFPWVLQGFLISKKGPQRSKYGGRSKTLRRSNSLSRSVWSTAGSFGQGNLDVTPDVVLSCCLLPFLWCWFLILRTLPHNPAKNLLRTSEQLQILFLLSSRFLLPTQRGPYNNLWWHAVDLNIGRREPALVAILFAAEPPSAAILQDAIPRLEGLWKRKAATGPERRNH